MHALPVLAAVTHTINHHPHITFELLAEEQVLGLLLNGQYPLRFLPLLVIETLERLMILLDPVDEGTQ